MVGLENKADNILREQYASSANLDARFQLHARFSTNSYGWLHWVFDRFLLPPRCRVLEIGCGTGALWAHNASRIQPEWKIALSDASFGMVTTAKKRLDALGGLFHFAVADAHALPFADQSFDAAIANHMLYHCKDVDGTLRELRRVLKRGGRLYATTNGRNHMNVLRELVRPFAPDLAFASIRGIGGTGFSLDNGAAILKRHFANVALDRYLDALQVTEADALVEYVLSVRNARHHFTAEAIEEMKKSFQEKLASSGHIYIPKSSGIFCAS